MMNHATARLILNGQFAEDAEIRRAIETLRDEGLRFEERVTREPGESARLAAGAVHDGIERVIACGGDGTINEVVNGLFRDTDAPAPALGILPLGTANDFACGCGIPPDDPAAALRAALLAPAVPVDVGRINDQYFLNAVSLGFGAEVTATTPRPLKDALGGAAYSLQALLSVLNLAPYRVRLVPGDGGPTEDISLYFAAIANGCQAGGGYHVAPHARLDDGRLDLMVIREIPVTEFPALIAEWQEPDHPDNARILYRKLSDLTLESDDELHLTIDGNPASGRSFRVRVLPRGLRLVVPDSAPLGSGS